MHEISVPFSYPVPPFLSPDEERPRRITQRPPDPDRPYAPVYTGLFQDESCWFYLPEHRRIYAPVILIFSETGKTAQQLLEEGYREALEKTGAVGCFLITEKTWNYEQPGKEIAWCLKAYLSITDGEFFAESGTSVIGEGSGAGIAALFACLYSERISALFLS